MSKSTERVIIVGAGMAGLTSAAYLSRLGYDVTILEKNNRYGGLVSTFEREGFHFDTGPRAFVNSGMVKPILKDLDIDWETVTNKISIAVEDKMFRVDSLESLQEYKKILLELYPEHKDEINKIMAVVYKLSKHTKVLYDFDNPYFVDYVSDLKNLFKKLIPFTFKLLNSLRVFNQYGMPMEDYLHKLTDNESLIDILTQFFFKETPSYFALGYFYVYMDYFYPKNGTRTLPEVLHQKIIRDGGEIQLNTHVTEVIPAEKKVVDSNGNQYEYDHLIWATDLKTFYKQLNQVGLDQKTVQKVEVQKAKIQSAKTAESVFVLFLGVDRDPSFFKDRGGEHMFFTPSKLGLGEVNRSEKQDLLDRFESKSKAEVVEWIHKFCDLNTFEVSVPALRDLALSPAGKTGIMISCLFDYDIAKKIDEAGWIEECKTIMEERIIHIFSNSIYPDLAKDVLFRISSTPLSINEYTGNSGGAIVGWSFETKSPVPNKLKDIAKSVLTPITDIYQASQWAYAPAGVPIAMLTGWHATQRIIKNTKK